MPMTDFEAHWLNVLGRWYRLRRDGWLHDLRLQSRVAGSGWVLWRLKAECRGVSTGAGDWERVELGEVEARVVEAERLRAARPGAGCCEMRKGHGEVAA
jgi:hypothetical protein